MTASVSDHWRSEAEQIAKLAYAGETFATTVTEILRLVGEVERETRAPFRRMAEEICAAATRDSGACYGPLAYFAQKLDGLLPPDPAAASPSGERQQEDQP